MMLEATIFADWMDRNCTVRFCEDCKQYRKYELSPIKRCRKIAALRRVL